MVVCSDSYVRSAESVAVIQCISRTLVGGPYSQRPELLADGLIRAGNGNIAGYADVRSDDDSNIGIVSRIVRIGRRVDLVPDDFISILQYDGLMTAGGALIITDNQAGVYIFDCDLDCFSAGFLRFDGYSRIPFFQTGKTAFPSLKDNDRYSESYSQSRDAALAFSGSMVISNTVSYPVYRNNVSGTVKDVTGTGFTLTATVA